MTHELVITIGRSPGDGLSAALVCIEPEGGTQGCREIADNPDTCSIVEAFYWDTAAAMEDYTGESIELKRAPITIHGVDEHHFEWEFADPEPDSSEVTDG